MTSKASAGTPSAEPTRPARGGGKRSAARLAAVQALYEIDIVGAPTDAVLLEFMAKRWRVDPETGERLPEEEKGPKGQALVEPDAGLLSEIVRGVAARVSELDASIGPTLSGEWTVERLEVLLRAILRAGAFELLVKTDVPTAVVITEYVDVAHAFFAGNEPALVNAVLDRLARTLRPGETDGASTAPR
jgi:N utilization substance protein B